MLVLSNLYDKYFRNTIKHDAYKTLGVDSNIKLIVKDYCMHNCI